MNKKITKNFILDIIREFNRRYPQYKDKLTVFSNNKTELTFSFNGVNYTQTLSEFYHDYGLESFTEEELLWLNITDLFSHIVSEYIRNKLEETLNTLTDDIKNKLIEASKNTDIDIKTLYAYFEASIRNLRYELTGDCKPSMNCLIDSVVEFR